MTNEMKLLQARKLIYEVIQSVIYHADPDCVILFAHKDSINLSFHDGDLGFEITAREEKK